VSYLLRQSTSGSAVLTNARLVTSWKFLSRTTGLSHSSLLDMSPWVNNKGRLSKKKKLVVNPSAMGVAFTQVAPKAVVMTSSIRRGKKRLAVEASTMVRGRVRMPVTRMTKHDPGGCRSH